MKTKEQKRREAEQRNEKFRSLTPEQQLAKLDAARGKSTRQRDRIKRQMKEMKDKKQ